MSAVFGNDQASLLLETPDGAFNSAFNASWSASGINPAFLAVAPDLADDTYATIGLEGPASVSGIADAADPSIVEDANQPITPYFLTDGATSLESTTLTGASWYILNTAANGLPDDDMRVFVMQVTTGGAISGQINYQVFPLGVGADQEQISVSFSGEGEFGTSEAVSGCTNEVACNYDALATEDDGSCDFCSCGGEEVPFPLVVETNPAVAVEGATVYRFYVQMTDPADRMSAVFGNVSDTLMVSTPSGAFNSSLNASWNASGINPLLVGSFPELLDDSYATVGLDGPASASSATAPADASIVGDGISDFFQTDGSLGFEVNDEIGASWYVLSDASNGSPNEELRVLIMQVTTTGSISGKVNYQVFDGGLGANAVNVSVSFTGEGSFGTGGNACGCTDEVLPIMTLLHNLTTALAKETSLAARTALPATTILKRRLTTAHAILYPACPSDAPIPVPAITIPWQHYRMDLASSSLVSDARMSMRVITMNLQPSLAPAITIPAQVVRMSRQPITTQRSPWTMALVNSLVASSREHAISIPMRMSTTSLASTSRVSICCINELACTATLRQPLQTAHACSLALSVTMETTKQWMM